VPIRHNERLKPLAQSALTVVSKWASRRLFGFKGRFVRKKGFQYAHVAMPLNLLDLIRTLPDDTNTLQGNRNLLIE
jgi:hypothetical protein